MTFPDLTERELELLVQVSNGATNRQAAHSLGCHEQTIKNHMSAAMLKLGAPDRTSAVVRAIELGLIDLPHRVVPGALVDEMERGLLEVEALVQSGLAEITRLRAAGRAA